jgi:5-methylcytosine-specific restriction endonuclease McrA
MKDLIIKLRSEGKTYNEIVSILGCAKATVSYHCGEGQKEKKRLSKAADRKDKVFSRRIENFQRKAFRGKTDDFQRRNGKSKIGKRNITFKYEDVLNKFGWDTRCYLTGRPISLKETDTYHFDHMTPASAGGSDSLDNLGIACKQANQAKADMTVDQLLTLCKEILENHGHSVSPPMP